MTHSPVIIIGAGISGIKAAIDLQKAGIDCVILEARDRLGGRLLSIDTANPDIKYDMGALWFHDSLNNPLYDKAIAKGNIKYYYDDGSQILYGKGNPHIDTSRLEPVVAEIMTYTQLVYSRDPSRPDVSLKELCHEYIAQHASQLDEVQLQYATGVVRMWAELWHGESWDRLSGRYAFHGSDHLGRNVFVLNGYVSVFNNELNELSPSFRENNIKLNTQIKAIDYSNPKNITVTDTNGKKHSCQYLISTIPQSLLTITDPSDSGRIEWTPKLPAHITSVLPSVYFGSLGKVFFEFDEAFWPKDVDRFYAISESDITSTETIKPWDYSAIFVNLQAAANFPALATIIQDPVSRYIENLDPKDKDAKIWALYKPLLQQVSQLKDIPQPKKIIHTPWSNDKFARGSYATVPVGCINPEEIIEAFGKGVDGRIRFAGAETVGDSANGCAHGGWFSGQREAAFIIDKLKSNLKSKL
ncbi:acetylspermidine oxidase [Suhomyces tanzawaensis NRRL Y-17324]|uniref:Acetylspermidine oxidase n=1 Tax=Suhomyces tanzawaensis NRRL Y-17324 TaxID=984487 RepID=A0A1E4SQI4_9ASCO|nr:acetylspermidine oxidase [Suhomyces tanzawaensis NRRL Y-17324]ODV81697.1 acetylspermidine oxidase [Suhomyces tanzawaensis NRRL Y-17324]